MDRETIYSRLRELEISPEVADMTAELLEPYSDKKVEALIIWLRGYSQKEASGEMQIGHATMERMLSQMRECALVAR